MFVNIDLSLSCVVNLDDVACWDSVDCEIVKVGDEISNEEKLKILMGESDIYTLWDIKEVLINSDIGDYTINTIEEAV